MQIKRSAGILLHPTSLPGPYGIGDFGSEAYRFVDFLNQTGQTLWQILPLNPTGYGNSPYASPSAFAGNPLLINPTILQGEGLLTADDLADQPQFSNEKVEYDRVQEWKMKVFARSFERFNQKVNEGKPELQAELSRFEDENQGWLEDYSFFVAAKNAYNGAAWSEWDEGLRLRRPDTMSEWQEKLAGAISLQKYIQFLFFRQWKALKDYANNKQIKIIGDVPIFVAYDSADVWANQGLFFLDEQGHSTVVSGTPPDDFSATGQYWGNPLYRWNVLAEQDYRWWLDRLSSAFKALDIVRLDHFRGFEAYWEIPVNKEQSGENGRWVKGPGMDFFRVVRERLGNCLFIAEDLGSVTSEVVALRTDAGFPGMGVLLFAFGGGGEFEPHNPYLPHNLEKKMVAYTGNHDTDTVAGWFNAASELERKNVLNFLGLPGEAEDETTLAIPEISGKQMAWKLIRLTYGSVAAMAIVPFQDLLGLDSESRMNKPGEAGGNWGWRFAINCLDDRNLHRQLNEVTRLYARTSSHT